MQLYSVEYVGHWGKTVALLTDSQAQLWRDGGAEVVAMVLLDVDV